MPQTVDQKTRSKMLSAKLDVPSYVFFGFFTVMVLAFIFRLYGAIHINFTGSEASYAMRWDELGLFSPSLLQNLVNRIALGIPEYSPLVFRLTHVVAGTLITVLPFFLRNHIGNLASVILGFFLAIDPFLIANSVLITGNTMAVLVGCVIALLMIKGKYPFIPFLLIFMALSGRGFAHFLLISLTCIVFIPGIKPFLKCIKDQMFGFGAPQIQKIFAILGLMILVFIFLIAKTDFDILIVDLANLIKVVQGGYQADNLPWLYPVALLSYLPLAIVMAYVSIFQKPLSNKGIFFVVWIASSLFITIINPSHRVIDLVWVTIPLWFITAKALQKLIIALTPILKENLVFLLILFVCFGNLYLGLLRMTYKLKYGLPTLDTLIALLSIVILIIALVIYWAYLKNLKTSLMNLSAILILFLVLAQISNASHTAGVSGYPETEIFWDGYFSGKPIVGRLIETSIANQFGTLDAIEIWSDRSIRADVFWDIRSEKLIRQISNEQPETEYPVIIRNSEEPINLSSLYLGQKFVAKEYPEWVRSPISSLLKTDFWSWVFMRESQPFHEYNYLWLKADQSS